MDEWKVETFSGSDDLQQGLNHLEKLGWSIAYVFPAGRGTKIGALSISESSFFVIAKRVNMGKSARRMRRLGKSNKQTAEATADAASRTRLISAVKGAGAVLMHYANESNWASRNGESIWLGEGDGPDLAKKILGIEKKKEPSWEKQ